MLLFEGNCEKYYKILPGAILVLCFTVVLRPRFVVTCDLVSLFPFCLGDEVKKKKTPDRRLVM